MRAKAKRYENKNIKAETLDNSHLVEAKEEAQHEFEEYCGDANMIISARESDSE